MPLLGHAIWSTIKYRPMVELGDSDYVIRWYLFYLINRGHQVEVTKNDKAQDYSEPREDES